MRPLRYSNARNRQIEATQRNDYQLPIQSCYFASWTSLFFNTNIFHTLFTRLQLIWRNLLAFVCKGTCIVDRLGHSFEITISIELGKKKKKSKKHDASKRISTRNKLRPEQPWSLVSNSEPPKTHFPCSKSLSIFFPLSLRPGGQKTELARGRSNLIKKYLPKGVRGDWITWRHIHLAGSTRRRCGLSASVRGHFRCGTR